MRLEHFPKQPHAAPGSQTVVGVHSWPSAICTGLGDGEGVFGTGEDVWDGGGTKLSDAVGEGGGPGFEKLTATEA